MNPRIYEALACGALVVSEWRPEIAELVPELPTFTTEAECVALVAYLLAAPDKAEAIRAACAARLASHTYADRLQTVLATVCAEVAA
jgi:spore maturation protein CgeB